MGFKRISILLFFLFFSIFSFISVFSSCNVPSYIKLYSGNNYLGEFNTSDDLYINPNLAENSIRINYFFENSGICFNSSDDMKMKLFQSSSDVYADSYSSKQIDANKFEEEFDFTFQADLTLSSDFVSTYTILNSNSGDLNFKLDDEPPIIISFSKPSEDIYKSGTMVNFDYSVQDLGSGLNSIRLYGENSHIINLEGNKTYTGSFTENLTSSTDYSFEVYDKLSHKTNLSFSLFVDDQPPVISNIEKSYSFENNIRKVSFSVKVSDDSFQFINSIPNFYGDFSQINPEDSHLNPSQCVKDINDNSSFICQFEVVITLGSTSNINIIFNSIDSVGNNLTKIYNTDIFVDHDGPNIVDFYMINGNGVKNYFSAYDNSSKIYLKFTDDSLSLDGLFSIPRIIPHFSKLDLMDASNCNKLDSKTIECVWELGNKLNIFALNNYGNETFQITVIDNYGNPSTKSFIARYDNVLPIVNNITFEEKSSIKDGIIQSGENVDFKILVSDKYLSENNQYFVKGLFSQIAFDEKYLNWTNGNCHPYNSTSSECVFRNIKVGNGYLNRSVFFLVSDISRNKILVNKSIQIFKIGNETNEIFIQNKTFDILNPINRNSIIDSGVIGWFEGNLEFVSGISNNSYKIINYQLKPNSCKESDLDPLLLASTELYPEDIYYGVGDFNKDKNFVIKSELGDNPNYNDLNDKIMTGCQLSVLYRDNTTIYPPEIVTFSLKYGFYDLPRGSILYANAAQILEKTNEVEFMNGWFKSIYDIYKIFDNVCKVINGANSIMGIWSGTWTGISYILWGTGVMSAPAKAGDKVTYTTESLFSNFLTKGPIKKMCDWVTCRNGGIIGAATGKMIGDIPGFKQLYEFQGKISDAVCGGINSVGNSISKGGENKK